MSKRWKGVSRDGGRRNPGVIISIGSTGIKRAFNIYKPLGGGWASRQGQDPLALIPDETTDEMLERGNYWKKTFKKERQGAMLMNVAIAALMMVITTAIHPGGIILVARAIRKQGERSRQRLRRTHFYWVGGIVLLMFFVSLVEMLVRAATYLALNAIQGLEKALYFSMVTFTTLGYIDVVLDEHWRLLASFEAANGIIMFGWTTAIVIAAVQRIYFG